MTSDKRQATSDKYDYSISAIRFIAMLMIITCHFMQYLGMESAWWFNVGVQVFFVISGFLYGKKTIEQPLEFYKKSFSKILIPYWAFLLIAVIVQRIFVPDMFSWGKTFMAFLCLDRLPGLEHLWFVQTILICYLILPLLLALKNELLNKTTLKAILGVIFVFLMIQFVGFSFKGYSMAPNRVTCFAVGIFFAGIVQRKKSLFKLTIVLTALAVFSNLVRVFLRYIKGIPLKQSQLLDLFTEYAHGLLGISLFLVLYLVFKRAKECKLLKLSDEYSYCIYLVHQVFILGPLSLMTITNNTVLSIAIISVLIIIAGVLLKILSYKVFAAIEIINRRLIRKQETQ